MKTEVYPTFGSSALDNEYISDIPWEKAPAFSTAISKDKDLEIYKKLLDITPTPDQKILFKNDVWDFSPYCRLVKQTLRFDFNRLPRELRDYAKFFVLHQMTTKTKMGTIAQKFQNFAHIYTKITEENPSKDVKSIKINDIIQAVERKNLSLSSVSQRYFAVYEMYYFLINHCNIDLPIVLKDLQDKYRKIRKRALQTNQKTPNIPEEYYTALVNKATEVMRNSDEGHDMRMTAAAVVLLTQTGLRPSDLLALTTDRLIKKRLTKSGKEVHYIHYVSLKPSPAGAPLEEFDVYCSQLGAEAFSLMRKLRKNIEIENKGNTLFVLSKEYQSSLPYPTRVLRWAYANFVYHYLYDMCSRKWDGVSTRKHRIKGNLYEAIQLPKLSQFRVHFFTSLYERGVNVLYIEKYMGHLSEAMAGYYARPKDTYQEDIKYSEDTIKEIAAENLTPLGGAQNGEHLKEKIQEFIKANNFNVYTDIEEIVKAFGSGLVIRGKRGGVCIRANNEICANDKKTDQVMCAYGICPNLFHFYYMLDVTDVDFRMLQQSYQTLVDSGYKKAAEKERKAAEKAAKAAAKAAE